jgi:hypothetical protein
MAETPILNAAVAVATVYENTARGSGKTFWNVLTDTKDRFTAFSRDIVAHLIDGRTPTTIQGRDGGPDSLAYNLSPPLNTMLFFEARATGKVLVPTPVGTPPEPPPPTYASNSDKALTVAMNLVQMPPPNPPGTVPLPAPPPAPPYKPPYRPNAGYQAKGGGWRPEDKRPGLVTMNEAYAKDIIVAIIGNSADLKLLDYGLVLGWATAATKNLSKNLLEYSLAELQSLGFKLEPEK